MENSKVLQIKSPIVDFKYLGEGDASAATKTLPMENLCETTERPAILEGRTYKLRSPVYEAALYITINNIVLNLGTDHEQRRPFEIFINSKAMESFQWIVALTRMISGVFRKGGDVTFIVEELKAVNDPKGGYWKKGQYIPSIVAEIAQVIEQHFIELGLVKAVEKVKTLPVQELPAMRLCPSCGMPTLTREAGCDKCLSCSWSRCG
jgi:hypothetical protein